MGRRIQQDELTQIMQNKADMLVRENFPEGTNPADFPRLRQTIRAAQSAYCDSEAARPLTRFEFLMEQSRYIRKRWWILQGLLLAMAGWQVTTAGSSVYTARSLGIAGPVFAVLILPEIWKNRSCSATEVEGTAYYSLRQIYAARLTLLAMADLLLITVFCSLAVQAGGISMADLAVQFLLPFNVTCCICFRTLYSRLIPSEGIAMLLCVCWIAVWSEIVLGKFYEQITIPVWCGLAALSAAYLVFCIVRGQRNLYKLLEVEPVWN